MSYASLIATAAKLIREKGVACKWRSARVTIDDAHPWKEAATTPLEYATYVVLLPFDSVARRMFGYLDGRPVPAGTLLGYVPGSESFAPKLRDTILVGTVVYTVGAFDILNPNADKDIIYVVELHR